MIDEIVPEPTGGAHTNHELAAALLDAALERALADVSAMELATSGSRRVTEVPRHGQHRHHRVMKAEPNLGGRAVR